DAEVQRQFAQALMLAGRYEEGLAALATAATFEPSSSSVWSLRGEILRRQGQLAQAVESFQQALAADANDWQALAGLGRTLTQSGSFAAATEALNRAAELRPDNAAIYLDRARLARAMKNDPA